ncbi:hypothetical protein [Mycoplasma sp. Ms02]|uniref:hypothetical protein n=1 Tax=Mycoplasma sp. Ms02 TaxID=353851 RepID=UPI001C8AD345|nr:hypothetical protein [Mycoplasma sp. Ms02]QZE12607.1 hypothetical protein K4L35_01315 [Mycoplasma sp. Ms02]
MRKEQSKKDFSPENYIFLDKKIFESLNHVIIRDYLTSFLAFLKGNSSKYFTVVIPDLEDLLNFTYSDSEYEIKIKKEVISNLKLFSQKCKSEGARIGICVNFVSMPSLEKKVNRILEYKKESVNNYWVNVEKADKKKNNLSDFLKTQLLTLSVSEDGYSAFKGAIHTISNFYKKTFYCDIILLENVTEYLDKADKKEVSSFCDEINYIFEGISKNERITFSILNKYTDNNKYIKQFLAMNAFKNIIMQLDWNDNNFFEKYSFCVQRRIQMSLKYSVDEPFLNQDKRYFSFVERLGSIMKLINITTTSTSFNFHYNYHQRPKDIKDQYFHEFGCLNDVVYSSLHYKDIYVKQILEALDLNKSMKNYLFKNQCKKFKNEKNVWSFEIYNETFKSTIIFNNNESVSLIDEKDFIKNSIHKKTILKPFEFKIIS